MYLEGSMLFVVGAAFSMCDIVKPGLGYNPGYEAALVVTPYFMGGICFTVGAYAGVLEVINIHNKDDKITDWFFTGSKQWNKMR
jgi:hypothetical protein